MSLKEEIDKKAKAIATAIDRMERRAQSSTQILANLILVLISFELSLQGMLVVNGIIEFGVLTRIVFTILILSGVFWLFHFGLSALSARTRQRYIEKKLLKKLHKPSNLYSMDVIQVFAEVNEAPTASKLLNWALRYFLVPQIVSFLVGNVLLIANIWMS